jgi:arylsulfatase A-like enzyme
MDEADEKNGSHTPGGPLSGGKYSKLEAGTRVPFITCWPGRIQPGVSAALTSQIDLLASFAALAGATRPAEAATDSLNALEVLLGKSTTGRDRIVEQGINGLSLRQGNWKFIPAAKGPDQIKTMRTGNSPQPQLYDLSKDPGENNNLAKEQPEKLKELKDAFETLKAP